MLTLFPAVDIRGGQSVRLFQGKAGSEKVYGSPVEVGRVLIGAGWLHVVDLDAAFGEGDNRAAVRQIVDKLGVNVDVSGGLRDSEAVAEAFAAGASRVSVGTAALERPEWVGELVDRYGDKVAVDLACSLVDGEWRVSTHGWVNDGGDLWEVLERFDQVGCRRFVVTDVSRDGAMSGPNVELLREVAAATDATITASGGVSTLEDLRTLARYEDEGIDGIIVGKALVEGAFTVDEALEALGYPRA
ncbi:bifunctional 1-(5-phosphoribosyl)-5-((5-phosphoribosylamino)methylideneamino)imidazole-4-carboxamide isomerase/phosphoribosylanthranilate isomerase PriA [Corynebacterium pyruviciproducens]|uniref:1-(5-phosphoribosyl)-5-[(5-phosphoribosylamino)methylideneamino] imidazole-4-carboxamide isomerase n=1 Tax=Corynebacterium pyruviciproducens TaxID=598660 RepID=A0AAF0YW52_9CORY|nr:bifunctional 1-(5-phosphoribosyl)-5-((5-phosphoribosylamino)methylideneamino)imidazole-4-carboxamide isomerase/phosphoribosylanthranilate isomerase PriA [Corynebacterium pyruviciproducens]MDK6566274.1 bifunctional 1-(5-phosphoribosyl)-5-((5-phosphoribosylamino)methylideneamino)imidazole-4-carboxamide isomerase/phosphoribosylanthranilate isomerase PriA [Corynebacterium pyruviciproducens]MDK7214457.1 bifunctional 1-(5-phosphoribosyl)-5-((5-phosphoribosylamino)methylideneamino)imidazole-4-carboxa